MNALLNVAVKAARRGGKTILRYCDQLDRIKVEQKGRNDFVSEVDRIAEANIIDAIHARYPDHAVVAEERGGDLAAVEENQVQWIIDPLDGTANYLHGHPQFAVSIAARQNGQLQLAVIFDPLRDELYTAMRGQGAQLNRRRIRVSDQPKLSRAILATGFPHRNRADFAPWLRTFESVMPRVGDLRRCGSAALDLAYVACGRLDGYWESGLQAWDIAAGALLVREAGGLAADIDGGQDYLESGRIVAANRLIFNDLVVAVGHDKRGAA